MFSENELLSIILGCDGKYTDFIIPFIEPKYFTDKKNALIFSACQLLFNKKHKIDNAVVGEVLQKNKKLTAEIGYHLAELTLNYCSGANYQFYIDSLIDAYKSRLITSIKTTKDFIRVQEEIEQIGTSAKILPISHEAPNLLLSYYDENIKKLQTGYKKLDKALGCFMGGDYVVLAGATGMGKTWAMLNFVRNFAKQGHNICIVSLEMSLEQIQNRFICLDLGLDSSKYRKTSFSDSEIGLYCNYTDTILPKYNIDVVKEYNVDTKKIRNIIKKKDYDAIFIDYLGLISGDGTVYEKFSKISRDMKEIALEENIVNICLHQINRGFAERQDKRPRLSDLRDSGKIEQDADSVLFIHRPYYFEDKEDPESAEVIIAKNRHGQGNFTIPCKLDSVNFQLQELCSD